MQMEKDMTFNMENKDLTEEQLWLLCEKYEKELLDKKEHDRQMKSEYRDKGIDYEYWQIAYTKSKNLKQLIFTVFYYSTL